MNVGQQRDEAEVVIRVTQEVVNSSYFSQTKDQKNKTLFFDHP
jgi:hypothetical protein